MNCKLIKNMLYYRFGYQYNIVMFKTDIMVSKKLYYEYIIELK